MNNHKKSFFASYFTSFKIFIFIILIALSLTSCQLFNNQQSTPTEEALPAQVEPTATIFINPTATLPAHSAEVITLSPQDGSVIGLSETFTITFNQAMDQSKTNSAISMSPEVTGEIIWFDETTLQFSPAEPLELSTHYTMTINETALSLEGNSLSQAISFNFQTIDPLETTDFFPGDPEILVDPYSAIWVAFNQPIVNTTDTENAPDGFKIEPAVAGAGRWANSSTYIFYPAATFLGSTEYSVSINQNLVSLAGARFVDLQPSFSFTTQAPQLLSIDLKDSQNQFPITKSITIDFSLPMNTDSVETNTFLVNAYDQAVDLLFSWDEDQKVTVTPSTPLLFDTGYTLTVSKNAKSKGGISLTEDSSQSFFTQTQFIISEYPDPQVNISHNGYAELSFEFSKPLDPNQDLIAFFDIRPYPPGNFEAKLSEDQSSLTLTGFFRPSTYFTYSISPDLADQDGYTLGESVYKRFATTSAPAVLNVASLQEDYPFLFIPLQDTTMPAETTNVRRINFESIQLSPEEFINLFKADQITRLATDAENTTNWYQIVSPYIINAALPVEVTLKPLNQRLNSGLYLYKMDSNDLPDTQPATAFLTVAARTQLTIKQNSSQIMVWAIDTESLETINNVYITLFDKNGNIVDGGATDARGLVSFDIENEGSPEEPFFAMVNQPGDDLFGFAASSWSGQSVSHPTDSAFILTDQPSYLNGDKVNFKVFVNQNKTNLPGVIQANLFYEYESIRTSVQEKFLSFNDNKTAVSEFTLPTDLNTGNYFIEIDALNLREQIEITKSNPTNILLKPSFLQDHWSFEDTISGQIQLMFDFGAPIQHQTISWSVLASPINAANIQDWSIGMKKTVDQEPGLYLLGEGSCKTDNLGNCQMDLTNQFYGDLELQNQSYQLILRASYDYPNSDTPINAMTASELHPDPFYIGIQSENWGTNAGEELGFKIQTFDWLDTSIEDVQLLAHFQKLAWHEETIYEAGIEKTIQVMDISQQGSTDFYTDQNGFARLLFVPETPGVYRLLIESEHSSSEQWVWIGGTEKTTQWYGEDTDQITMSSNKSLYQAGETAQILIPNPFESPAIALITIESENITREQILTIEGNSTILELPLSENDSPGVYLSVSMFGKTQQELPAYRQAFLELPIETIDNHLELSVSVLSDKKEDSARLEIETKTDNLAPTAAELSLLFFPKSPLGTRKSDTWHELFEEFQADVVQRTTTTSIPFTQYARQIPLSFDVQQLNKPPSGEPYFQISEDHLPNAYWLDTFSTDDSGKVIIELPVHDLENWQCYLVAVSNDGNAFGQLLHTFNDESPILLNVDVPTVINQNETLNLPVTIANQTQADITGSLLTEGNGFESSFLSENIELEIAPRETKEVIIPIQVTSNENIQVVLSLTDAEGDNLASIEKNSSVSPVFSDQIAYTGVLKTPAAQWIQVSPSIDALTPEAAFQFNLYPTAEILLIDITKAFLNDYDSSLTQTNASKILAVSSILTMANQRDLDPAQTHELQEILENTLIPTLTVQQNADGGWGKWPYQLSDVEITMQAVYSLISAKNAGITISNDTINAGINYLIEHPVVFSNESTQQELLQAAFLNLTLITAELDSGYEQTLVENWEILPLSAKALLAMSLQQTQNHPETLAAIIEAIQNAVLFTNEGALWGPSTETETTITSTALITLVLSITTPEESLVMESIDYLLGNRSYITEENILDWGDAWQNGWALTGVSAALVNISQGLPNYNYTVNFNHDTLTSGNVSEIQNPIKLRYTNSDFSESAWLQMIHETGEGVLFFDVIQTQSTNAIQQSHHLDNYAIERSYRSMQSDCRPGNCQPIYTFDRTKDIPIQVRLAFTLAKAETDIIITDRTPTGMQFIPAETYEWLESAPVNNPLLFGNQPRFSEIFYQSEETVQWILPDLSAGSYELTYYLIPNFSGEFFIAPAQITTLAYPERTVTSFPSNLTIEEPSNE